MKTKNITYLYIQGKQNELDFTFFPTAGRYRGQLYHTAQGAKSMHQAAMAMEAHIFGGKARAMIPFTSFRKCTLQKFKYWAKKEGWRYGYNPEADRYFLVTKAGGLYETAENLTVEMVKKIYKQ